MPALMAGPGPGMDRAIRLGMEPEPRLEVEPYCLPACLPAWKIAIDLIAMAALMK
jgi:hypothetical protein